VVMSLYEISVAAEALVIALQVGIYDGAKLADAKLALAKLDRKLEDE